MAMVAAISLIATLQLLQPKDGAVVPTMKDGQAAYFSGSRAERFVRLDNPADRQKLFLLGSAQKPLALEWSGPTNAVYLLNVVREGADGQTFAVSNRTCVYITNLELDSRFDWSVRLAGTLESASGSFRTAAQAPRLLRAGGVGNFRDLGGWVTTDGRRVRQNRIFRSAGLRSSSKSSGGLFASRVRLGERRVTDAGLDTLRNDFKIRTDLELRTPQETAGMDASLLGATVNWQCVSFAAYDFIDNAVRGREPFAKVFRLFTKEENYPILFHCSGGRDRTGTLSFLLNGLLGVSEDDLCRDWEATVFSDMGRTFTSARILRLLDYLKGFPGETLQSRIEAYVRSCGISDAEIGAFRSLMLQ